MCNTCGCKKAESFEVEENTDNVSVDRLINHLRKYRYGYEQDGAITVYVDDGNTEGVLYLGNPSEGEEIILVDNLDYSDMDAESFEAENGNKLHILMKENTVDNQYGKYDGEEYFEMHITQSKEELRGKVKEYLDDLVSGDEIDDYLEKIGPFPSPIDYDAKEAEIKAKINSPNTPLSDLFDLLNEMSEALEESRGDYGERYSYYTSKDKVLTVKGIHPDALYMAESFDADFDNAPYDSFDEAMSDNVSFPEKEYEIDDRDIYNPERAAMDMIRSNRALREQMEEQGVYVGRHPGYYDDNGQWVELMEHYDDYERIPNWLQGLVGVGLVGGLAFLLNKMTNTFADTGNNTTEPTE